MLHSFAEMICGEFQAASASNAKFSYVLQSIFGAFMCVLCCGYLQQRSRAAG